MIRLSGTVALCLVLAACAGDEAEAVADTVADAATGTDVSAPEALIFPLDFAKTYVEVRNCRRTNDHLPGVIRVSASPEAADAYTNGTYPFAIGTVLVKTIYDDTEDETCQGEVTSYSVMRKISAGTTAEDWEWQETDAAGVVLHNRDVKTCKSCHTGCTFGRDMACTDP